MKFTKDWLIGVALALASTGGCFYGKHKVDCPDIVSDTTYVYDTVWRYIPIEKPFYVHDTIKVPKEVPALITKQDTLNILADYFAEYEYQRTFEDSLLIVILDDKVTQNKIYPQSYKYKYKAPTSTIINTIDKSVTYNRYVYLGLTAPLDRPENVSLGVTYAKDNSLYGLSYSIHQKSLSVSWGLRILKLKEYKK